MKPWGRRLHWSCCFLLAPRSSHSNQTNPCSPLPGDMPKRHLWGLWLRTIGVLSVPCWGAHKDPRPLDVRRLSPYSLLPSPVPARKFHELSLQLQQADCVGTCKVLKSLLTATVWLLLTTLSGLYSFSPKHQINAMPLHFGSIQKGNRVVLQQLKSSDVSIMFCFIWNALNASLLSGNPEGLRQGGRTVTVCAECRMELPEPRLWLCYTPCPKAASVCTFQTLICAQDWVFTITCAKYLILKVADDVRNGQVKETTTKIEV